MHQFRIILLAAVLSALMFQAEIQAVGGPVFELRGIIRQSADLALDGNGPIVQISGVNGNLQLSSVADAKGRFRFKKVPAGMYLLTAFIPRMARTKRTIEVGPSFADRKGCVAITIQLTARPRRLARFQISAAQLGIPKQAQEEYEKGIQRLEKHDRAGASGAFSKALTTAPKFAAARYQLGVLASQEGRLSDAVTHFREALTQMPANYQYLLSLGRSLLALRDGPQAVSVNEAAARSRPDDSEAQVQLGFSYMLAGRLDDAEKHLKETIALDPANYLYPQLALAEIYNTRQDPEAAAQQLEEFLKLHPDASLAQDVARILSEVRRRFGKPVKSGHPR
jgi:Tfp pilus assembly protein PilF